ncbi:MAG: hydrogenase expression/formation protein HypE [Phycisphaerae bacterium]|nr:hydrogenase expression/formation protein HypE [Phycisphaerae bacterium]
MNTSASVSGTYDRVVIAHGGGGELMGRLIREHFLPPLKNETLKQLTDGAVLPWSAGELVFTTDSYVVTPLEFPGGDIGRLAVVGTVNDLAVMGAKPIALSLGLIIEEGLPLEVLDRIVASIAATAREAGVEVVTGDTKVIERRQTAGQDNQPLEGLFINTAGIGHMRPGVRLGLERIEPGDVILVNGNIADHGLAVMSVRSGIEFDSTIHSDAAPLNGLIAALLETGADVKFLRDATRGGIAGVLADICEARSLSIEINENRVPLAPATRHAAEMLGLDPLTTANEGKCVIVMAAGDAGRVLAACRAHPLGKDGAVIGRVFEATPPLVELITRVGGRRIVQRPYGEELPRIC